MDKSGQIPVTVFTGYLGAGKTTIIRSLVDQLGSKEKIVWLKNEFGDAAVDSVIAKDSNIAVREITNGCLCCVLVGQLGEALRDIADNLRPDRIFIETSGSAYPAPLAWEVSSHAKLRLDGIVTVIDVLNFPGYADKSYTAKLQCKCTDLVLLNKHELVDVESRIDQVLDDIYELCGSVPKVRTSRGNVSAALVLGLKAESCSALLEPSPVVVCCELPDHVHVEACDEACDEAHHSKEVDVLDVCVERAFTQEAIVALLQALPREDVYRAKGVVVLQVDAARSVVVFNYVFGRYTIEPVETYTSSLTKMTFMGQQLRRHQYLIASSLAVSLADCKLSTSG